MIPRGDFDRYARALGINADLLQAAVAQAIDECAGLYGEELFLSREVAALSEEVFRRGKAFAPSHLKPLYLRRTDAELKFNIKAD